MHLHRAKFTPLSRFLWRGLDVLSWLSWLLFVWYAMFVGPVDSEPVQACVVLVVAMCTRRYLASRNAYCSCRSHLNGIVQVQPADYSNLTILTMYDGGRVTRKEYSWRLADDHIPVVRDKSWPAAATGCALGLLLTLLPVCATVGAAGEVKTVPHSNITSMMAAAVAAATVAAAAVTHVTPESKVSRPKFKTGAYDKSKWAVDEASPGRTRLKLVGARKEYVVPKARINSALHILDPDHLANTIGKGECRCSRNCRDKFNAGELVDIRMKYNLNHASMEDVQNSLSCMLRANMTKNKQGETVVRYHWGDTEVCSAFYAAAVGIGRNTAVDIRELAVSGGRVKPHAAKGVRKTTKASKSSVSVQFWDYYLDKHCQGWKGKRYFPAGSTSKQIYETHFGTWFDRVKDSDPGMEAPKLTVFREALKHEKFRDVKRAPKHTHCRCDTCETIKNTMRNNNTTSPAYINAARQKEAHAADVLSWRELEKKKVLHAAHSPSELELYRGDDTEAVCFPKAGHRPMKSSANKYKLKVRAAHHGCM